MSKAELVEAMAEKSGLSKTECDKAVKAFTDVVGKELAKGERVQLIGFGTFEVANRAARSGRNPRTGEVTTIPATKVPRFKAGSILKEAVK